MSEHALMAPCLGDKEGYQPITTQIFDSGSDYLDNDSVFAVKTRPHGQVREACE
jgi:catechol 1,2-dioxygenase